MKQITDSLKTVTTSAVGVTEGAIDTADAVVSSTYTEFERTIAPVRKKFSQRYPFLFFSAVVVGVTSTLLGIEQILLRYRLLQDYPWVILGLGLSLLLITGTLYKKLG